ncbi:phosphatase PAP2 family protein [Enterococcus lemanii]|uniref:Phosphatase PAP2 family protein n=1 Tax=Enterococcus lemanii TaxID=1159752 RepID=A0ABV9MRU1_9ENTE|nr:phosphatase PAP2 family protein [Enterococcus lemanii]MBM7709104.1 undecaprenyl-diphosphatase [Enterococcus lemanii]
MTKNKLYYQFAGSCFLLFFTFLGYTVKFYPQWLKPFDTWVIEQIGSLRPQLTAFFLWITQFANPLTVVLLGLTLLFVLLYGKQYAEVIWLSGGVIGIAGGLNPLLKLFFNRTRPSILAPLITEHSLSFPSGHATASMVLYGSLFFLLPLFIDSKFLQYALRSLLVLIILSIGVSRIYLGVHFPTDIIGGFSLSLSWLLLTFPIYQEKRFIWRFQNKQH